MDVDSNSNLPLDVGGAGGDAEGDKDGKEGKDHSHHPPAKRYRLTDAMKSMVRAMNAIDWSMRKSQYSIILYFAFL